MYLQYLPRTYQNKVLVTTMDLFYQLYTDLQIHFILPKMLVFNSTLEYIPALPSTKKKTGFSSLTSSLLCFLAWQMNKLNFVLFALVFIFRPYGLCLIL